MNGLKLGDMVYVLSKNAIYESKVIKIICEFGREENIIYVKISYGEIVKLSDYIWGKKVDTILCTLEHSVTEYENW